MKDRRARTPSLFRGWYLKYCESHTHGAVLLTFTCVSSTCGALTYSPLTYSPDPHVNGIYDTHSDSHYAPRFVQATRSAASYSTFIYNFTEQKPAQPFFFLFLPDKKSSKAGSFPSLHKCVWLITLSLTLSSGYDLCLASFPRFRNHSILPVAYGV